jgi:hypothetical protein
MIMGNHQRCSNVSEMTPEQRRDHARGIIAGLAR